MSIATRIKHHWLLISISLVLILLIAFKWEGFIGFVFLYKWVLLFYLGVMILVYLNRKRFDVESKFVYIYRTKFGLKLIDKLAAYKRTIHFLSMFSVVIAFAGIGIVIWMLGKRVYDVLVNPYAIGVAPILPGLPIAGTGLKFPFLIGWLSLFIIIVIHEFSHGIVSKSFNVKVKSSGIAFFGPILGAFVEPDEKKLVKQKPWVQNSVFAAGPMANIITGLLFFLILGYLLVPAASGLSTVEGLKIMPINGTPAMAAGIKSQVVVSELNNHKLESIESFLNLTSKLKPNETAVLTTLQGKDFMITTGKNPANESMGYLGVSFIGDSSVPKHPGVLYKAGFYVVNWLSELFLWLYFISINLGLINLFPIFITDGARMLQTVAPRFIKDKQKAMATWKMINQFCLLMILVLLFYPWIRQLFGF